MGVFFPVVEDAENEVPVPTEWRGTLKAIADAFADGDFRLDSSIQDVLGISDSDAFYHQRAVVNYGATLVYLPAESWQSSVCQWMIDYWDVMVDLYTAEEGRSDLVLRVRVYAEDEGYRFEVHMLYVP